MSLRAVLLHGFAFIRVPAVSLPLILLCITISSSRDYHFADFAPTSIGYGPPDNISISLSDEAEPSCTAVNPTGFRDFEIGSGHVNCGNAQDIIEFYGDSNKNSGNNGSLYYNGYVYNTYTACKGTPRYGGSFPLSCTRDAGGNATCGLKNGPVTLTLLSFQ